jgi:hypothetical protein
LDASPHAVLERSQPIQSRMHGGLHLVVDRIQGRQRVVGARFDSADKRLRSPDD